MELKTEYDKMLDRINYLTQKEIENLSLSLNKELETRKKTTHLRELLLNAPNWSDSDYESFKGVRTSINNSRLS